MASDESPAEAPAPEATAPDPAELVARLVAAGDWPDPALFEQLVAAGEAVVGPLLDFMKTYPPVDDHPREIALFHGIGVLGAIRSREAIPVLLEVIRRYPEESGEEASRVLGEFGEFAFGPALELVQDPAIIGYPRQHAVTAARHAAGADPALRSRLGAVLRPMLADAMERTRALDRRNALTEQEGEELAEEAPDDQDLEASLEAAEDDLKEAREEIEADEPGPRPDSGELEPYEELMFLIMDLSAMADPEAEPMIKQAFAEDLVDSFWIDEKSVESDYREGGLKPHPPQDWLADYREEYRRHIELMNRPATPRLPAPSYREGPSTPPPPPQETIRNTGPKLGRNDPCWCGSGKKYKKCHLGKDDRS